MSYSLASYSYHLPEVLIAQEGIHPAHNARMMCLSRNTGRITDEAIYHDLAHILSQNHVIYFNDSKVLPSRLTLENIHSTTAGGYEGILKTGEIFFLKNLENSRFEALVKPGNKFKVGTQFAIFGTIMTVEAVTESGRVLSIEGGDIMNILEKYGNLPLPPYIEYTKEKEQDYQTVFAKNPGSVAAPTASLHFTQELLDALPCSKEYVTLHVGLGTFLGIKTADIRDYHIHEEFISLGTGIFETIYREKNDGKTRIAVGTTVCRTLESLPYLWKRLDASLRQKYPQEVQTFWDQFETQGKETDWIHGITVRENGIIDFATSIYITPGFQFCITDELITNFHLPESSLLVLVSAFLGRESTLNAYEHAIKETYRFYSFGDGMYIHSK